MICAIAERSHAPNQLLPPIDLRMLPTTPVMMAATMMTPSTCQKFSFARFQERFIASVPRRFSITTAGMLTDNNVRKMMPGMISKMNPTATVMPTRNATSSTLPNRLSPHR